MGNYPHKSSTHDQYFEQFLSVWFHSRRKVWLITWLTHHSDSSVVPKDPIHMNTNTVLLSTLLVLTEMQYNLSSPINHCLKKMPYYSTDQIKFLWCHVVLWIFPSRYEIMFSENYHLWIFNGFFWGRGMIALQEWFQYDWRHRRLWCHAVFVETKRNLQKDDGGKLTLWFRTTYADLLLNHDNGSWSRIPLMV